jgi:hypothetical protein
MAITFRCPECKEQFEVEEKYGGRKWHCTNCSTPITIPDAGDVPLDRITERAPAERRPAPPPRYDDRRPPRRREEEDDYDPPGRELSPSWSVVRAALRVITIGVSIFLVTFAIYLAAILITLNTIRPGMGPAAGQGLDGVLVLVSILLFLASLALVVLWIVGQSMCCAVPSESGAKGLATGSLVCTVTSLVVGGLLIVFLVAMARPGLGGGGGLEMLGVMLILLYVIGIVGYILFLFFLRCIAVFFGNDTLAINILIYFIVFTVFLVGNVAFTLLAGMQASPIFRIGNPNQAFATGMAIMILEVVGALGLMVWFLVLLTLTAGTIPRPRLSRHYY